MDKNSFDLHQLQVFTALVKEKNFSEAGKLCHLTQPAVSFHIKALEKKLGVPLVERTKRRVFITQAGEIFFRYAQEILSKCDEVQIRLSDLQNKISGHINIATINSVGVYELPKYLKQFLQTYPTVNIYLSNQNQAAIYELVTSGKVDFGILAYPEGRPHLTVDPFIDDEMVVVCGPEHRLAKMKTVRLTVINHENFIAFEPHSSTREAIDELLRSRQVTVNITGEFDNIELIKKSIEVGQGIGILPRNSIQKEWGSGELYALKLSDVKFNRPLGILYRKNKILTTAMKLFLALLKKEKF